MHTIYNSRNSEYKTPFGAVECGECVTFKLHLPLDLVCKTPHIVLTRDGESKEQFLMKREKDEEDRIIYSVTVKLEKVGLYFYHFDLYKEYKKLFNSGNGMSYLTTKDGHEWQLTVYEKSFSTPQQMFGGVMYQIFPDRFYDGITDSKMPFDDRIYRKNKQGEPYFWPTETGGHLNMDYFGGDFVGIEKKLPYLKDLGVTVIYLNPIFEAHSNHRYNTADYMKADPLLGTNQDFANLCKAAKANNISVIIDGVFSHTGSDSVYFNREKRYGGGGAYNDATSTYRKWFDFNKTYNSGYRSWWGFETLPETNENDTSFRNFICGDGGVIDTWMRLGADGFRLDVADELPDEFIEDIRVAIKKHGDDKYLLGEVWEDATTKWSYGKRRTYLLGKGLDATMNYPFKEAVLAFCKGENAPQTAEKLMSVCENYPHPALHVLMNFMSTHDTVRAITALAGESCEGRDRYWQSGRLLTHEQYEYGIKLMRLAYAMIFTLPGIPSIYYGDEIAMQGYKDPFNRAYFNWENKEDRIKKVIVELAKLRRECSAFKNGAMVVTHAAAGVLCYERSDKDCSAHICINRTDSVITVTVGDEVRTVGAYDFVISVKIKKGSDNKISQLPHPRHKKSSFLSGWFD